MGTWPVCWNVNGVSRLFVVTPGVDRPYGGPVGSSGHGYRTRLFCQDTRSGYLTKVWSVRRYFDITLVFFVGTRTGFTYTVVRSVRRYEVLVS